MLDPEIQKLLTLVPSGSESAFPQEEYARRQAALRERMATRGIDLYLTSGPENVFYLSGQQTPGYYTFQCLAIPAAGEPFHVLRGLESMNARANTYLADISGYPDDANPAAAVAQVLAEHGWKGKRVAIDQNAWFLTVNLHQRLTKEFADCLQAKIAGEEPAQAEEPSSGSEPAFRTPAVAPSESSAGSSSEVTPRAQGRPVKGLRLALWAAWRALVRALKRLFGPRQG